MKPKFTDASRYRHGYKPAVATDVRATIDRERKRIKDEQEAIAARKSDIERERLEKLRPLLQRRKEA